VQLIESYPPRPAGGAVRTQYLTIDDSGAAALLGARPDWLWGMEHGINQHGVAIGNERVFTVDDPDRHPPGLIGMDLVRLGLERATSADQAVALITDLIQRHGQGGVADPVTGDAYSSSFLIADPDDVWIVETSARDWAAHPVADHGAISNRITLTECSMASNGDPDRFDPQSWIRPDEWTVHADQRLKASRNALAQQPEFGPRDMAAALRDHGGDRWGGPGADLPAVGPPVEQGPDGEGWTVCMHVRQLSTTTSSMIGWLDRSGDHRAWLAPGAPCVSVFVPVSARQPTPAILAEPDAWQRLARLRELVDADPTLLTEIRADLDPLEAELWDEADELAAAGPDGSAWTHFSARAGQQADVATVTLLDRLR
jgi:secernin